jgi:metal-responsive CopG/Arc/MetJ family transcriptional regulator
MERKQQKKDVIITVRMDQRLARKIKRYARREEFEVSEAIRRMIREFFRQPLTPSVG